MKIACSMEFHYYPAGKRLSKFPPPKAHLTLKGLHMIFSCCLFHSCRYATLVNQSHPFLVMINLQLQLHNFANETLFGCTCLSPVNIKSYAYDNGTLFVNWRGGKEPAMKDNIRLPNFRVGIGGAVSNKIVTSSSKISSSMSIGAFMTSIPTSGSGQTPGSIPPFFVISRYLQ